MKSHDVLILHGWNLSGDRFRSLQDKISKKGYRVFSPDFPGFGNTPALTEPWHIRDYADFLKQYIEAHRIKNPIIIGHSFGGRVALSYVQKNPKGAYTLILTGTPGFSPVPAKKMLFFLIIAKMGGLFFALPLISKCADVARRLLYRAAGAHEFYRAEGSMRQTFKYTVQDNLENAMRAVSIPCMLVWGEMDTIVPVAIARKMNETISGSTLTIIPNASHGVPFMNPDAFMKAISNVWN